MTLNNFLKPVKSRSDR